MIKKVTDTNALTGVVISFKYKVNSNDYKALEGELSIDDLKEVFSDIFYVAEDVYLDTYKKDNGIFPRLILKNSGGSLIKQRVRKLSR